MRRLQHKKVIYEFRQRYNLAGQAPDYHSTLLMKQKPTPTSTALTYQLLGLLIIILELYLQLIDAIFLVQVVLLVRVSLLF